MSWDTDLLSELIEDEFDTPFTDAEIMEKSAKAMAKVDDADDAEDGEG